jgi:hypothetical protein
MYYADLVVTAVVRHIGRQEGDVPGRLKPQAFPLMSRVGLSPLSHGLQRREFWHEALDLSRRFPTALGPSSYWRSTR